MSPVQPCLVPGHPFHSPTGTPRRAAGEDTDDLASTAAEAHFCFLFWFHSVRQAGQRDAATPSSCLGFLQKTSRLLLGEGPPQNQHYSSKCYVHLPQAARQARQEPDNTLILIPTQDFPPLHSAEGCRCTSTASLTRSPDPAGAACPQKPPHPLSLALLRCPNPLHRHFYSQGECKYPPRSSPARSEHEGISASTAQGAPGKRRRRRKRTALARSCLPNTMRRWRMARDYNLKGFYALKGN